MSAALAEPKRATVPPPFPGRWLNVEEAAEYSRLSSKSIRRMIAAGRLSAHRPTGGIKIVLSREELDAAITAS